MIINTNLNVAVWATYTDKHDDEFSLGTRLLNETLCSKEDLLLFIHKHVFYTMSRIETNETYMHISYELSDNQIEEIRESFNKFLEDKGYDEIMDIKIGIRQLKSSPPNTNK